MFDAHHHYPSIWVPIYLWTDFVNHIQDYILNSLSIKWNLANRGPIIVTFIQIIPVHLVNPHSKDSLELRIHSFGYEALIQQFIDINTGCMAIIEDEGMPKWLWLGIEGGLMLDARKKLLINCITVQKVWFYFFPGASIFECLGTHASAHSLVLILDLRRHICYILIKCQQ